MSHRLLLDEMFTPVIAQHLCARGHDVTAVVDDQGLLGLPDDQVFAAAIAAGRALVTANIKDFAPLDAAYKAAGRTHTGLVLVSAKTFPQDRSFVGVLVEALAALLTEPDRLGPDRVIFLQR
jgi:hypothetical protein